MSIRQSYYWLAGLVLSLGGPGTGMSSEHATADSDVTEYVLWYRNYDSPPIRALFSLALEQTPEYGAYKVTRSPEMGQGRVLRELEQPQSTLVDIANVATSNEREDNLRSIPIPIDGGLLGLRVCVVLRESLPMFEGIKTLSDLQQSGIRIGQGTHWPDSPILQASGIPVITHSRYEILFRMLENHRFECFARGVSEVVFDLELEEDIDFIIEPDLLIAYPMPSYFFVSRANHEVAQRIQLGIERAIHDGSFGQFLEQYYGNAVDKLNLDSRHIIVLDNPYLTSGSWDIGRQTLRELRRRIRLLSAPQESGITP